MDTIVTVCVDLFFSNSAIQWAMPMRVVIIRSYAWTILKKYITSLVLHPGPIISAIVGSFWRRQTLKHCLLIFWSSLQSIADVVRWVSCSGRMGTLGCLEYITIHQVSMRQFCVSTPYSIHNHFSSRHMNFIPYAWGIMHVSEFRRSQAPTIRPFLIEFCLYQRVPVRILKFNDLCSVCWCTFCAHVSLLVPQDTSMTPDPAQRYCFC